MKILTIILLIVIGLYWLVDHTYPLPFNHEQFGLYNHSVHRAIGVAFFIIAGIVFWKWKPKAK